MTLEAIERPLAVKMNGRLVHLRPGIPMDFTDAQGLKLKERAPGRVRIVAGLAPVTVGAVVTWDSPLFGILSGPVLEVLDTSVTIQHPLTAVPCTIPKGWLR